jgi:DNA-directed RNA polymerase specialized sigma24 family protein
MSHPLPSVAPSSLPPRADALDAVVALADEPATLQEALAAQRDALRRFIVLQLTPADGGALSAHAFVTESRAVLRDRGLREHATWQFGLAASIVWEMSRAAARQLHGGGLQALSDAERRRVEDRLRIRLATLDDDVRDLLLAVAMHALSMDQAGLLLTRPIAAARDRVARALRRLHDPAQVAATWAPL